MAETKICAGCGANFGCGRHDADCWCVTRPALPAAALNGLRDCYCPRCLAALVAARRDDSPSVERSKD